ncbi:WD repeat-containing protein 74, variant 2 [Balamuthia mandrillaris]
MQGSGGNSHPRQRGVLPGSEFTVVVGTDNGLIKVVRSWMEEEGERKTVLHTQWGTQNKDLEVERIVPSPLSAGEVFVCRKNGEIALHNVDSGKVISAFRNKAKEGKWVGLHCWAESGRFLSCDAKGHVQYWKLSQEVGLEEEEASLCETAAEELQMRAPISQFRIDPVASLKGAFGGNENELKVWDMEQKKQIWEAKNVANDFLDLRVPVWINDLQFLPQDPNKIVTGTAYHQIRLYDITAQRRPVLNASCGENPVVSLCMKPHGRSVIFADTVGNVTEVDLRNGKSLGSYKGISGAIQGLDISPSGGEEGVVCSASLDRFLRLHDAQSRRLLLKVQLLLLTKLFTLSLR